eukprot:182561-Pelagomonas_calceolata.AAC.1
MRVRRVAVRSSTLFIKCFHSTRPGFRLLCFRSAALGGGYSNATLPFAVYIKEENYIGRGNSPYIN